MSQFVIIPPLERLVLLFEKSTGCRFIKEVVWKSWNPVVATEYEWLYEYIRPSHQKLLIETINGIQDTPCSVSFCDHMIIALNELHMGGYSKRVANQRALPKYRCVRVL